MPNPFANKGKNDPKSKDKGKQNQKGGFVPFKKKAGRGK
jgi:hypothetical protein